MFGDCEGVKVEFVGNFRLIGNVKVLANLTNVIVSILGLQLLKYELLCRKHSNRVEIKNIASGVVIYGVLAAGMCWIHLEHVYD